MASPWNLQACHSLIRGYGHVKTAAIEKAKVKEAELLATFAEPSQRAAAE